MGRELVWKTRYVLVQAMIWFRRIEQDPMGKSWALKAPGRSMWQLCQPRKSMPSFFFKMPSALTATGG